MTRYIVRADLVRGEIARSHAPDRQAIDPIGDVLDRIVAGQTPVPVPDRPGYWLSGGHVGRSLLVTLDAGQRPDATPLLTIAVCLRSRDSARLWQMLHAGQSSLLTRADQPPATPWLAERVEGSAIIDMPALRWSGSLAQALAWAWMEYTR